MSECTIHRKLFCELSPFAYRVSVGKNCALRTLSDAVSGERFAAVRERTPLSTIDFELIRETPQLMAFSATERARKLGGAQL